MYTLLICPTQPIANGAGIQKRAWSHLEALSRLGTVDIVLILSSGQIDRLESLDSVRELCRSVKIVRVEQPLRLKKSGIPGVTLAKRWITFGQPTVAPGDAEQVRELQDDVSKQRYDLVFCFRLRAFALMPQLLADALGKRPKTFVDFDDIESIAMQRMLDANKRTIGFEQRQIMRLERMEVANWERTALREAQGISVCSELDAQRLRAKGAAARICVVPNSLPKQGELALPPQSERAKLLFLGTMTYLPNEDAALYFCREILPVIRANATRGYELDIVGRGPSTSIRALEADAGITVHGGVESVEPFYAKAEIVVVPIRFGGGTRIKILEALAFGRAVVSTTIGAEGLDLVAGRDILIADTPKSFADACIFLAEDVEMRKRIARAGRARFGELYESRRVQDQLSLDLREIVSSANGRAR